MRLADLVAASRVVAGTSGRLEKIRYLADLLKRTPPDEIEIVVACLTGEPRQGRLGVGWAQLAKMRDVPAADAASLELRMRPSIAWPRPAVRDRRKSGRGCCASCWVRRRVTNRTFCCDC